MTDKKNNAVDLRTIFLGQQKAMDATLTKRGGDISHSVAKGDYSEDKWRKMLRDFLPTRYQVDKAFVMDSQGHLSEQIDVVIYDRQYSPFLFKDEGLYYIPAESVYAVIEVKQQIDKPMIEYAAEKALSVRNLHRTNARIKHAGGEYEKPEEPKNIIAGIVSLNCGWNDFSSKAFESSIQNLNNLTRLDLGCALKSGAFSIRYSDASDPIIKLSTKEESLIFFSFTFFLGCKRWEPFQQSK